MKTEEPEEPEEPAELRYIEPFFKSLHPKVAPLIDKDWIYRFVCDEPWRTDIGLVTDYRIETIRIRAKYRVFKLMEKKRLITFCSQCNKIVGCRPIDGFNKPWEDICAECVSRDSERVPTSILRT